MVKDNLVITIDGPAGSGKSTVARLLARKLSARLLETGALYRCVALKALEKRLDLEDGKNLARLAASMEVRLHTDAGPGEAPKVELDELMVTEALRAEAVSNAASRVAALPEVRASLLMLQRSLASRGMVVAEGRDMGTVVFPEAKAKFFITADEKTRALRRFRELEEKGEHHTLDEVQADQKERDLRDQQRSVAPLKPAEDAVVLDTSNMTPEAVVDRMLAEIQMLLPENLPPGEPLTGASS